MYTDLQEERTDVKAPLTQHEIEPMNASEVSPNTIAIETTERLNIHTAHQQPGKNVPKIILNRDDAHIEGAPNSKSNFLEEPSPISIHEISLRETEQAGSLAGINDHEILVPKNETFTDAALKDDGCKASNGKSETWMASSKLEAPHPRMTTSVIPYQYQQAVQSWFQRNDSRTADVLAQDRGSVPVITVQPRRGSPQDLSYKERSVSDELHIHTLPVPPESQPSNAIDPRRVQDPLHRYANEESLVSPQIMTAARQHWRKESRIPVRSVISAQQRQESNEHVSFEPETAAKLAGMTEFRLTNQDPLQQLDDMDISSSPCLDPDTPRKELKNFNMNFPATDSSETTENSKNDTEGKAEDEAEVKATPIQKLCCCMRGKPKEAPEKLAEDTNSQQHLTPSAEEDYPAEEKKPDPGEFEGSAVDGIWMGEEKVAHKEKKEEAGDGNEGQKTDEEAGDDQSEGQQSPTASDASDHPTESETEGESCCQSEDPQQEETNTNEETNETVEEEPQRNAGDDDN